MREVNASRARRSQRTRHLLVYELLQLLLRQRYAIVEVKEGRIEGRGSRFVHRVVIWLPKTKDEQ